MSIERARTRVTQAISELEGALASAPNEDRIRRPIIESIDELVRIDEILRQPARLIRLSQPPLMAVVH